VELTSTRYGEDIHLERERSQSTRGKYTSTRYGEDIPGKGEITVNTWRVYIHKL
jgi:hypothetical protein